MKQSKSFKGRLEKATKSDSVLQMRCLKLQKRTQTEGKPFLLKKSKNSLPYAYKHVVDRIAKLKAWN